MCKKACTYRKKACILKSNFEIQRHYARGGSSDSSDEDMASYDGDSNCHSDEDEETVEDLFMQHVPWLTA